MLKTTLAKYIDYFLISVNTVEKDKISNIKCKNIKKIRNKIVEIFAKLKS